MTITDEPDEDAAKLDDDALFEAYFEAAGPGAGTSPAPEADGSMPDWPAVTTQGVGLTIDGTTLGWFKANHADWRREMSFVLRAWATTQTTGSDAV